MSLLSVNFMGLPLKNPIIAAAGPWCRDAAAMQKAIDAGAAAVVTETITLEKSHVVSPRIFYRQGEVYNTTLYSTMTLEDVEQEVERLQKGNAFLICNIRGTTPSELRYLASRMQRLGADALELCCFTPIGTKLEDISIRPEEVGEMVRSVTSAVEIPVMVRLPHHAALNPAFARQITQNGARAISAIESLEGINGVDIENARCEMAAIGGCTGSHLRPLSLAATAVLHQLADCEIAAMCGVEDWHSVIEFLMMGATAVEMGSAIMLRGYGHITETLRKLEDWLREKGYSSLDELRGNALSSLTAFEELPERLLRVKMAAPCDGTCPDGCRARCVGACLYDAISQGTEGITVDAAACSGCGLCVSLCPKLCAVFSCIPSAVLGGVALSAFGTILVSGMNVIHNGGPLTARTTTIVAISLAVGVGFSAAPDALAALPFWASSLLSGVPGTAITAVVLSLILPEKKEEKAA